VRFVYSLPCACALPCVFRVVPRQRRLCRAATHGKEKVDGNADFSRSDTPKLFNEQN
jgi:hypothetical protein